MKNQKRGTSSIVHKRADVVQKNGGSYFYVHDDGTKMARTFLHHAQKACSVSINQSAIPDNRCG